MNNSRVSLPELRADGPGAGAEGRNNEGIPEYERNR